MSEEIVTSVGGLGASRRSYQRLYATLAEPVDNYSNLDCLYQRMSGILDRTRLSRAVIRAVVSEPVLEELHANRPEAIETALSLENYDATGSWLVMLARNKDLRAQTLIPRQTMMKECQSTEAPPARTLDDGYRVVDGLSSARYDELHALWGTTFEWSKDQIRQFGAALLLPVSSPHERSLWFSGLISPEGKMVSAAMAERLQLPGFSKTVNLVESTEWRTDSNHPKKHVVPFVLRSLHEQVLGDVPEALIVAECNYMTRADKAGMAAGMVVPDRHYALQILVQNVDVGDGREPAGLRDFTFMWLPS